MTLKEKAYHLYVQVINNKVALLKKSLLDLSESAGNETKRSAGDKHETALAMLQIEQENITRQLHEATTQKSVLEKIDPAVHADQVGRGSLVTTNKGLFFLSIALGKATIENKLIIALSPESPLGKAMLHLQTGDICGFNGKEYAIEAIE